MVAVLNSIDELSISANIDNTELIVELVAATFIHTIDGDLFPADEYVLETPDGLNAQPIVVGTPLSIPVGDFPGDGTYVCTIESNYGAIIQFEVKVQGGLVTPITTSVTQEITYDLDCLNYPDYPLQVDHHVESSLPVLEDYTLNINNNLINTDTYGGGEDAIVSSDNTTCDLPEMDIEYIIHTTNNNDLVHKTIFNTQCVD